MPPDSRQSDTDPVLELAAGVEISWTRQQPTKASFVAATNAPLRSEDLSDNALDAWAEEVDGFRRRLDDIAVSTGPNEVARRQLDRFVCELEHGVRVDAYRVSWQPYWQLLFQSLAQLLPVPGTTQHLRHKLDAASKWLECGLERARRDGFRTTDRDLALARGLLRLATKPLRPEVDWPPRLVATLEAIAALSPTPGRAGQGVPARQYVQDVIGVRDDLTELHEQCLARCRQEGTRLAALLPADKPEQSSIPDLYAWLGDLVDRLADASSALMEPHQRPKVSLSVAPTILSTLVTDALFLPVCSHLYLTSSVPRDPTAKQRAWLAMTLAHELFPGHGLHLAVSAHSPAGRLAHVYRSLVGFEGWAVRAESAASSIGQTVPLVDTMVVLHRVRRFAAATRSLQRLLELGRISDDDLWLDSLPDCTERTELAGMIERTVTHEAWTNVAYCSGLLATEKAVAHWTRLGGSERDYARLGPIHPDDATLLVGDGLAGATQERTTHAV